MLVCRYCDLCTGYETVAPTESTDRQCAPLTTCTGLTGHEASVTTTTTVFLSCSSFIAADFKSATCLSGHFTSICLANESVLVAVLCC